MSRVVVACLLAVFGAPVFLFVPVAHGAAVTLVADGFATGANKYTAAAPLQNQGPGIPSFSGAWNQGTGSANFTINAAGFTSTAVTYETGGSVLFIGAPTDGIETLSRNVTVPSSSTFYMSAIVNRGNANSITPGAYILVGFGNTVAPTLATSGSTLQGIYIGYSQNGSTTSLGTLDDFGDLVIRTRQTISGVNRVVDTVLVDGQAFSTFNLTYLVIAKLDVNTSGATDTLTYWVNPTSITSDAAMTSSALITGSVPVSTLATSADFQRLTFASNAYDAVANFDEPRIATDLASLALATPTPEPTCVAVLFPLAIALRRRR